MSRVRAQFEGDRHDSLQRSTLRVKPGREDEFLDAHKKIERNWAGLQHVNVLKTGDRSYCIIAEWTDMNALAAARPPSPRSTPAVKRSKTSAAVWE